jgi:Kef-type K+ transport system membrane component KefB
MNRPVQEQRRMAVKRRPNPGGLILMLLGTMLLAPTAASAMSAEGAGHGPDPIVRLMMDLAIILIFANIAGYLCRRFLRLPSVIGEVGIGILIGPYFLGGIEWPLMGPLFPLVDGMIPVTTELYGIAIMASILLLFMSGLETDLAMFLRYSVKGTIVGIGGIVFSFFFGVACGLWFGLASSWTDPAALFLGAIASATSVGITARILSEHKCMDAPEGVTILSAAVLDDVLCIILLAIVTGITKVEQAGGAIHWSDIAWIAAKGLGFWIILTSIGLLSAKRIAGFVKTVRNPGTIAYISLGLALLISGLSEMAGLAMIIGAYITGLAFSQTDLVDLIQNQLHNVYYAFVPVFFCVMGMLVDLSAMQGMIGFGLIYSAFAVASKVLGCGGAAWLSGFNLRGCLRIGLGMLPRGEVALIVAGIGLGAGAITKEVFGAAIMMTLLTTLAAPPLLTRSLRGGSAMRNASKEEQEDTQNVTLEFPSYDIAEFLLSHLVKAFRNEEFFVYRLPVETPAYRVRKDELAFTITQDGARIEITVLAEGGDVARYILLEELLSLQDLFEACSEIKGLDEMRRDLIRQATAATPTV